MVKAESEVVLLPSFVFAPMLLILMTHGAVRLCAGWCCQIFFPLHNNAVYGVF